MGDTQEVKDSVVGASHGGTLSLDYQRLLAGKLGSVVRSE